MLRKIFNLTLLAIILFLMVGSLVECNRQKEQTATQDKEKDPGELVIYSVRREKYTQPLVEKFERETGIKVKLLSGKETLVYKVLEERNNVQADIFWSTDAAALEYLKLQGVLEANTSPKIMAIDDKFRANDGSWFALAGRPRILIYNKDLISEAEMPKTLWELTDPKWKGQFMITRGGNGSMVAHVGALRSVWGDEKTKEWISTLAQNAGAILKNHGLIAQAVGAGEYKFGLINARFYHRQLMADKDNNVGAIYPDQGPNDMGAFFNTSGIALVKGAPNKENANLFLDFMLKPENQTRYVAVTYEIPIHPGVEPPRLESLLLLDDFKVMEMPLSKLGSVWVDVKKLIEEAGLDLNV